MRLVTRVKSLDELHGTTFAKCSHCVATNQAAGCVGGTVICVFFHYGRLRRSGCSGESLGQNIDAGDSLRPLEGSRREFRAEREIFISQKGCLRDRVRAAEST